MELQTCKVMCNECPFNKNSLKGWLGSHTVSDVLNSIQYEGLFSCHKQRGEDANENLAKTMRGEQKICRGFILSAKASCKMFGQNPNTGAALKKLQNEINPTDAEMEQVLSKWEFSEHHTI